MAQEEPDPRIPALQLLLGDASPGEKQKIIQRAFRGELLVRAGDFRSLQRLAREAGHRVDLIAKYMDGSSPIGRMGQENIRETCAVAESTLKRIARLLDDNHHPK